MESKSTTSVDSLGHKSAQQSFVSSKKTTQQEQEHQSVYSQMQQKQQKQQAEINEELKPKILAYMPDRRVELDGRAVFSCEYATPDPQAKTQVNWYHNSILITKSENQQKYVIRNDANRSILFILNVSHEDSGNYEIRIINKHGVVQQNADLYVGHDGAEHHSELTNSGFNISINKCHQHSSQQNVNHQHGEFNELIKFVNVGGSRRSESLNRSCDGERRASVTKVVMVKDHRRGSNSSCNCECECNQAAGKRYSITKILPVKQKYSSQDEISISAAEFSTR